MRSVWTHSICEECWKEREPDREPVRINTIQRELCCFCGKIHFSGIFVREDPNTILCRGLHE